MWTDKVSTPSSDLLLYSGSTQNGPDASWPSWVPFLQPSIRFLPWSIFLSDCAPGPFTELGLQRLWGAEQRTPRVSGFPVDQIVDTNRFNYGETHGDLKRDLLRLMVETIQNHGQDILCR